MRFQNFYAIQGLFLRFLLFILVCGVLLVVSANAQNRYEWTVYSALNSTQYLSFDSSGTVWAATTGGVVGYHPSRDSFEVYRTTEGLMSLNITATGVDPESGDLYAGGGDGTINIRSHATGNWRPVTDISQATEHTDRRILGFAFHNHRVYILTAFGVAVFNPSNKTILESWLHFGSLPANTAVNDILFDSGDIWLATDNGIARASETGGILADPARWRVYGVSQGIINGVKVNRLAGTQGKVFAATNWAVFERNVQSDTFAPHPEVDEGGPTYLAQSGDSIIAASNRHYYRYGSSFVSSAATIPFPIQGISISSTGQIALAFNGAGFGLVIGDSVHVIAPNSPGSNFFADLALAPDGSIWAANRVGGVSRLKGATWTQFGSSGSDIWAIGTGGDGTIWAGSYGNGADQFVGPSGNLTVNHFTNTNSPLVGATAPFYVVIGDIIGDASGNTWLTNWSNAALSQEPGPLFVAKLPSGIKSSDGTDWESFLAPSGISSRLYRWMEIDQAGTIWMACDGFTVHNYTGLLYFNSHGTISNHTDDVTGLITTNDGLLSNQQTALAIDADGVLWIGQPSGLQALDNPVSVVSENSAPRLRKIRALAGIQVRALAIDALNRKWVGTNQGIFVLSADGNDVVLRYTAETSPLADNNVQTILPVDSTGDIYIGTANGLNKISTDAVRTTEAGGVVTVSPHPFLVPTGEPLRISGLPYNAHVKILSQRGHLVREFDSPGGAVAFWDGKDQSGSFVASGIYLIAASDPTASEAVVGKVAVIRQ